jgi:hypothetical protein
MEELEGFNNSVEEVSADVVEVAEKYDQKWSLK